MLKEFLGVILSMAPEKEFLKIVKMSEQPNINKKFKEFQILSGLDEGWILNQIKCLTLKTKTWVWNEWQLIELFQQFGDELKFFLWLGLG